MKKSYHITGVLMSIVLAVMLFSSSCGEEDENDKTGFVTIGANGHVINGLVSLVIHIDQDSIGPLTSFTDSLTGCNQEGNISKELSVGNHTYTAEIKIEQNAMESQIVLKKTFKISEDECEKVFIDFYELFGNEISCDQDVLISQMAYDTAANDHHSIINMEIVGDCLKIKFSSSGCDGSTWLYELIDRGDVAESNPPQRTLRLSLENNEECDAVITKEVTFNIESLQVASTNWVSLNIGDSGILYEY